MAKRSLLAFIQFAAFFVLMFIGGDWDVIRLGQEINAMQSHTKFFNPIHTIRVQVGATHILILNGILFAGVLLGVIVFCEMLSRRRHPWIMLSCIAFVLAVVIALGFKMGLPPAPTPDSLLRAPTMLPAAWHDTLLHVCVHA